ncbi:hypothetical protein Indivirus_7_12 [Indivirus ILV1]|uniref:Uncharacterized protein n=1 Tax=Indivirus ILV1 TaxID=1977633 RepID=A0A1V0SE57_9VIRU|nr:hypothetical protein Indivirus_7_12 [Indivirus ILV1]
MTEENYEYKYKKYKLKYMALKNYHNMEGGIGVSSISATSAARAASSHRQISRTGSYNRKCDTYFWDTYETQKHNICYFYYAYACITNNFTKKIIKSPYIIATDNDHTWLAIIYENANNVFNKIYINKKGQVMYNYANPNTYDAIHLYKKYYKTYMKLFNEANKKKPELFTNDWLTSLNDFYNETVNTTIGPNKDGIYVGKDKDVISINYSICDSQKGNMCVDMHVKYINDDDTVVDKHFIFNIGENSIKVDKHLSSYKNNKIIDDLLASSGLAQTLFENVKLIINDPRTNNMLNSKQKDMFIVEIQKFLNITKKKTFYTLINKK